MFRWFENVGYTVDLGQLKRDFSKLSDFDSYLHEQGWAKPVAGAAVTGAKG